MGQDLAVHLPLLLVITGMPSSGKTYVAEGLARRLRLPLIAKDEIKESLYDNLGAADVATHDRATGQAACTVPTSTWPVGRL